MHRNNIIQYPDFMESLKNIGVATRNDTRALIHDILNNFHLRDQNVVKYDEFLNRITALHRGLQNSYSDFRFRTQKENE